ncbi:MAG: superoxide dismutase [Candidatus Eisenbacteria bacterium]|nr:superoxide dismutase [Candidatus Eisenbacteria bacterium]
MTVRRKTLYLIAVLLLTAAAAPPAFGHCQIPCGIYDDDARFSLLREHVTTIEKSMQEIERLSGEKNPDWNQIVRWVNNKDLHADELSDIATDYFLAQRVKPFDAKRSGYADYVAEITALHEMVVHAMKAKQSIDPGICEALRERIDRFERLYKGEGTGEAEAR